MAGSRGRKRGILLLGLALIAIALGSASGFAAARWVEPLPPPQVAMSLPAPSIVGGAVVAIPQPTAGAFVVADTTAPDAISHNATTPRPIASIAKTMTALAVLRQKPLAAGADGPTYVVTADDVALLHQVIQEDGSHVNVVAGERLTERQLLLGLMLPSANNFAIMLGRWVDGSDAPFVARLNGMAVSMGMTATHFADADGLDPHTTASARDLLTLGQAALAEPALRDVIAQSHATLPPGSGEIVNLDTLVGSYPGWLGIKTGHTNEGGYCLLFAAERTLAPGTAPVVVVGAVLGQASRQATFDAARSAVDAEFANDVVFDVNTVRPESGQLTAAWGATAATVTQKATVPVRVVRRGTVLALTFSALAPAADTKKGAHVADVVALLNGVAADSWPVVAAGDLAGPPWWWRLRR